VLTRRESWGYETGVCVPISDEKDAKFFLSFPVKLVSIELFSSPLYQHQSKKSLTVLPHANVPIVKHAFKNGLKIKNLHIKRSHM